MNCDYCKKRVWVWQDTYWGSRYFRRHSWCEGPMLSRVIESQAEFERENREKWSAFYEELGIKRG